MKTTKLRSNQFTATKRGMIKTRIKHFFNKRTYSVQSLCNHFGTNIKGIQRAVKELTADGYFCVIHLGRVIPITRTA